MDSVTCPYCKKNMLDNKAYDKIVELLVKHKCISNMCNPGGREFGFKNGSRIQIDNMCNCCDLETVKDKIKEFI